MNRNGALVEVDNVNKVFFTRHFFQRDENTNALRLYYKKRVEAARQINFSIQAGEVFGLLGPNGAGKTTTVKMIAGLVRPTAGAVYVDGLNVDSKRLQALRRIGVVLEGTRTSIWPLTPLENLAYYGNLRDVRGSVLKKRARELIEFIGLKDKMNVQVRHLSRGQKQKLAICIALISDPPVILLDEPTTGLDVQSSRSIKDKIREMTREHGKSVLVTTHDMHVAQELCDRIGIINNGQLIACRPTNELLDVFSECTFVFSLDRRPDVAQFARVPGVKGVEATSNGAEPGLIVRLARETDVRSESLYGLIEQLRLGGYRIQSISQEKQTLENVFLQLTSTNPAISAPEIARHAGAGVGN